MAHWQVWAPVVARVAATGLALVGLAGIGLAARDSPALGGMVGAPSVAGLAHLAGVSGAAAPAPAGSAPPVAPPAAEAARAGAAPSAAAQPAAATPAGVQPAAVTPAQPAAATPAGAQPAAAPVPCAPPSELARCAWGAHAPGQAGAALRVSLNQAGMAELQRLPGVGAKRAAAILELRQRLGGRFRRPSDLLRIKGIGPRTLQRMLPLLQLDAPGAGG